MRLHIFILPILAAAPITATADDALRIENLWIREAPPVAKVLAAYGRICNDHAQAVTIIEVTGPAFARVEMHETVETQASVSMRRLQDLSMNSGECVDFEPGGRHFMLFGPTQPLRAGMETELTFELANGVTQQVTATVQRQQDRNEHHHEH